MAKPKKRSTDDTFQVYRSLIKQFPAAQFAVSPKSIFDLQRLEFVDYSYNRRKKQRYENKIKKLTETKKLSQKYLLLQQQDLKKFDGNQKKIDKSNSQYEALMIEYTLLFNSRSWIRRITNFFGLFYSTELEKLSEKINCIREFYAELVQDDDRLHSIFQERKQEIDQLLIITEQLKGIKKPPVIDFKKLYTTNSIIHNRFERGLVGDLSQNFDIVGRAGLLAADKSKKGSNRYDRNNKMESESDNN